MSVRVTGKDILDAIEKNGFRHTRGEWFGDTDGYEAIEGAPISKACVMGQAALNLGVNWEELMNATNEEFGGFAADMINLNDNRDINGRYRPYRSLKVLARQKLAPYLEKEIELETVNYNAVRKSTA